LKEGVGCGVWGVGKETSFISGGENFFIETDSGNITKLYQKKSQNRASRVIKYKNAPCEIDPRSYL
jgi:hypothetical protein